MDPLTGLKLAATILFGTIYGVPLFLLGFALSVAGNLWTQKRWRNLYWVFVIAAALPFVAVAILPAMGSIVAATGVGFAIWMLVFMVASPFGAGVLVGAALAPLYR
jgi:hypothetical protein